MGVIALGLFASAINIASAAMHKRDPFVTALASFLFTGAILGIGAANEPLGEALAITYFASSLLLNGTEIITLADKITGQPTAAPVKK